MELLSPSNWPEADCEPVTFSGFGFYGATDPNFTAADGFESVHRVTGAWTFNVPPIVPETSTLAGLAFGGALLVGGIVRSRRAARANK